MKNKEQGKDFAALEAVNIVVAYPIYPIYPIYSRENCATFISRNAARIVPSIWSAAYAVCQGVTLHYDV